MECRGVACHGACSYMPAQPGVSLVDVSVRVAEGGEEQLGAAVQAGGASGQALCGRG